MNISIYDYFVMKLEMFWYIRDINNLQQLSSVNRQNNPGCMSFFITNGNEGKKIVPARSRHRRNNSFVSF